MASKINLATQSGVAMQVEAEIFGDFALHRDLEQQWKITHAPSGLGICCPKTLQDGRRVARRLRDEVPTESLPDTILDPSFTILIDDSAREAFLRILDDEAVELPRGPLQGGGRR